MDSQDIEESGSRRSLTGPEEAVRRQPTSRTVVLCRICLSTRPRMISIHSPMPEYDQKTLYAMLLSVCLPLNQRETVQGFPEQICRNCKWKLLLAYDLYETTLASDEQLRALKSLQTVNGQQRGTIKPPTVDQMVMSSIDSALVTPDPSADGSIRVKEETFDEDGYGEQYGTGSRMEDETSSEIALLLGDKLTEEDEDASLLEESKDSDPDPLEAYFVEHYQMDETSGNHVCGLCKQEFPYKSQCRMHIVQKHNPAKPFKCDICLCTLTSHLRLVRHKVVAHDEGQIKREDVIQSPNDTTGEMTYSCPICHKTFSSSVRFKRHKNVHVVHNRPFKCEVCLYRFTTRPQLTQHAKVHEKKPPAELSPDGGSPEGAEFPCDRCEETFPGKRALTMHLKKVHQVYRVPGGSRPEDRERSEYVCIICKETFARETVLNTHMKMHELLADKEKERRIDLERIVKQELQQHMLLNVPPLPPLSPEVVDRSASVLEPFALGLVPVAKPGAGSNNNDSSSINNNSPPVAASTTFSTPVASGGKRKLPFTTTTPTDLVYVCPVCEMEFDERESLKQHQKKQHSRLQVGIVSSKQANGPRPGSSPLGKALPTLTPMPGLKMRLLDAARKKKSEDSLSASMPGNEYNDTGDNDTGEQDEMLVDDSESQRPIDDELTPADGRSAAGVAVVPGTESTQFQCTLCHKTFSYNCYLTMHMRKNHDETKPFGCKVCHYRFGYRGTLLRHQLIHSSQPVQPGGHGSIIFKCRICAAKFLELRQLNMHLKAHRKADEVTFDNKRVQLIRCNDCPQIFSDHDQLRQHMVKEHRVPDIEEDLYEDSGPEQGLSDAASTSLRQDERITESPLTDLKLHAEPSKDDEDDTFMNELSIVKMEPNFD